mmetsp:Transcript_84755/g.169282  ORF Transcript_84755/g.169282 Transcript_84755/m.169282 type:complete len:737 (-) Transcript_84755:133-2343(-)
MCCCGWSWCSASAASASDSLLERFAEHTTMEKRLKSGRYDDFTIATKELFLPASDDSYFTSLERVRLTINMLNLSKEEGGCDYVLDEMIERKLLLQVVAVHETDIAEGELMTGWCKKPLRILPDQPLIEIREYFGERITLYFAFMQHLVSSLTVPAVVGMVAVVAAVEYRTMDNVFSPIYSIFTLLWISFLAKTWRTKEAGLAFFWNTIDFEDSEGARPEFDGAENGTFGGVRQRGIYTPEGYFVPLDDEPLKAHAPVNKMFPHTERRRRVAISYLVILPVASITVAAVSSIFAFRTSLQFAVAAAPALNLDLGAFELHVVVDSAHRLLQGASPDNEPVLDINTHVSEKPLLSLVGVSGGVMMAIVIQITNRIYRAVSVVLNDWENHRTETEYEDALIIKTFTFQAFNSYFALIYVAFVKATEITPFPWLPDTDYCHDMSNFIERSAEDIRADHDGTNPYCMGELGMMLVGMAVSSQFLGKLVEVGLPRLKQWCRTKRKAAQRNATPSWYERQIMREPYDVEDDIFAEYNRVFIQLGYVVLFAPAFPIASLVSYLSFLTEIRSDAFKLLTITQRPRYRSAQDIGSWMAVMEAMTVACVVTNVGIIGYTSTIFTSALPIQVFGVEIVPEDRKLSALIVIIVAIITLRAIINCYVPDYPVGVAKQRALEAWRARVEVERIKKAGGAAAEKDFVIFGNGKVGKPKQQWDDKSLQVKLDTRLKGSHKLDALLADDTSVSA